MNKMKLLIFTFLLIATANVAAVGGAGLIEEYRKDADRLIKKKMYQTAFINEI